MEQRKFKTNIKCTGCIEKVTPHLNEVLGEKTWTVDLNDPLKTLTVERGTDEKAIVEALRKAGYKGEAI